VHFDRPIRGLEEEPPPPVMPGSRAHAATRKRPEQTGIRMTPEDQALILTSRGIPAVDVEERRPMAFNPCRRGRVTPLVRDSG